MSKFGKFDEKETKDGNIRRIISKCREQLEKAHAKSCGNAEIEKLIKVMDEHLTDNVVKDLLAIANFGKILKKDEMPDSLELEDKFWKFDNKISPYERFLKGFYYDVLPAAISEYHRFDAVRADFLRYFILFDNFATERRVGFHKPEYLLEAFKSDRFEKIKHFSNIPALYEFAGGEIEFFCWEKSPDPLYNEVHNTRTLCFYNVFKSLFNDRDFFEAAVERLECKDIFRIVSVFESGSLYKMHEIADAPDKFEYFIFEPGVRPWYAKILFSSRRVENYLADDDVSKFSELHNGHLMPLFLNRLFFSAMMKLDPEYKVPIVRRFVLREVKKIRDLGNVAYFASNIARIRLVDKCAAYFGEDAVESPEVLLVILEIFLREKIVKTTWFKGLPEFLQELVIVEQTRSVFNKAEIVVVPDLPETNIDKDKLKKGIDKFMGELTKIARNGGKPSDYYAGNTIEIEDVADSGSYLTTLFFQTAVSFLRDCFDPWKALKPMLAIFRNLREQAYFIGIKSYEYDRLYVWGFVPYLITPLLGSLKGKEAEEVCAEWFKHLAEQLKSADDFVVKKREENPETVPEEFRDGYDITVIEPHPLWREAFCEAAGDLRVNLKFNNCKIFNHLKKNDIDKDVREAAEKTLERIGKIKEKFDSGSRKRALLNAWWWYRVAHLKSLEIDFDWVSAQNLKIKEVKINYPKNC